MPKQDEVRIVVVPLDEQTSTTGELLECLNAEERTRAERYKVEKARVQFVTGRGVLRRMLGNWLGVAPLAVPIAYTSAGKPVLADAACGLHFNISHTDGLALIAFGSRPIGIDLERVRPVANPGGLVDRFFSVAERESYRRLAEELRPAGFFRGWTCKEAVLKARGLSVALLDEFDVEIDPSRPAALKGARHPRLAGGNWSLMAVDVAEGFTGALAISDEP